MTNSVDNFVTAAEKALAFGRGNVDALLRSSQILIAGSQDLSKRVISVGQERFDAGVAGFKALAGAKSFDEAVKLHSDLARSTVEKTVAETISLTEASLKLVEDATAPLTARVNEAVEVLRPAA